MKKVFDTKRITLIDGTVLGTVSIIEEAMTDDSFTNPSKVYNVIYHPVKGHEIICYATNEEDAKLKFEALRQALSVFDEVWE